MIRPVLLSIAVTLAACTAAPGNDAAAANSAAANSAAPAGAAAIAAEPVTFKAVDGVTVFARYYRAQSPKALILLFHQAGSSKDEYVTIAPRLAAAGYSALAVDQRSGGSLFGKNETMAALGSDPGYLPAEHDLQAALDWGKRQALPLALWGSSYSSSLVFVVAAKNHDVVRAVLAFSPGEYFDDKTMVSAAAAAVTAPVYVTSANNREEIDAARQILAAVSGPEKQQYLPAAGGVHGSSTLIASRNKAGSEQNWAAVLAFLAKTFG